MKKSSITAIFAIVFTFISVLSFTSCNKNLEGDEVITVNGKAAEILDMAAAGDSKTVTVRSTKTFTVEAADWITVTPKSGEANKDVTITITVGANNTGVKRDGGVTFTVPSKEFATVLVNQEIVAK